MMNHFLRRCAALMIALLLCVPFGSLSAGAETLSDGADIALQIAASDNPLINPDCTVLTDGEKISLRPDVINILLLGIDDQEKDYTYRNEMAHTDAIMVLSIHLNREDGGKPITLISIPRDTLAYVPGVKGIYKINGAINCGDARAVGALRADADNVVGESKGGFEAVRSTVSWLLGGVQIDYYCAVTMNAMAELGDLIGGVDYDMEMAYTGHSGRRYQKGPQQLDGTAIVDYFRARTNATDNTGSDLARTNRQRDMMQAILDKFINDKSLIMKVLGNLQSNDAIRTGLYTDIDGAAMTQLIAAGLKVIGTVDLSGADGLNGLFGSYSLDGAYQNAFGNWKFRFINQADRLQVIREVFGIDSEPLRYVSYEYATWLYDAGFQAVRTLAVADEIRNFVAENYRYESTLVDNAATTNNAEKPMLTDKQSAAIAEFDAAYGNTLQQFLSAADAVDTAALNNDASYDTALTTNLKEAYQALRSAGNELAKLVGYPAGVGKALQKVEWTTGVYMDEDPLINEIYVNFR